MNAPETLARVCEFYGWTDDYALNMPAKRFFTMAVQSEELRNKRESRFYYELCDIVAISLCKMEYRDKLKQMYEERISKRTRDSAATNQMDPTDPYSASIAAAMLFQQKRLSGYG